MIGALKATTRSSDTKCVGRAFTPREDDGFTLMEMMIALMIMAVVLTALLPALFGTMRATTSSNARSVANGLAVSATEQMRSIPYYEVGWTSTPSVCANPNDPSNPDKQPVTLSSGTTTPLTAVTTKTVGHVSYTVTRCLYWIDSTVTNDSLAYKQSIVTVSWSSNGIASTITQTSAIYPGGEGTYQAGGEQNFTPVAATPTTVAAGAPDYPQNVTANKDPSTPANAIDVSWSPPAASAVPAVNYIVDYIAVTSTSSNCPSAPFANPTSTQPEPASASPLYIGASPGTKYCVDVRSVAGDGVTVSSPSAVTTATTDSASPTCTISNLVVNNSTTKIPVDSNGHLVSGSSIPLSVNAQYCSGVTVSVGYTTNTSTVQQANMTGNTSLLTGSAGTSSTVWSVGNDPFTVYVTDSSGLHAFSPAVQVFVTICQEKGNSGKC